MTTNARAMVMASFSADALALGAHWIYDTDKIFEKFGRVDAYRDPQPPTYHGTKKAGDFTHYGDQTLVLLESLAESSGFELQAFAAAWQRLFDDYGGYLDGATKQTLKHLADGAGPRDSGSTSNDLAGAARIAPLAYCYRNDLKKLTASARAQTAFTHNDPLVIDSAAFFARVAVEALAGTPPRMAFSRVQSDLVPDGPLALWLAEALGTTGVDTRRAIAQFGQMCEIDAAFPATVHLIAKYENDLEAALVENVMAGGDSAGRGLLAGMVLGAYQGWSAIPHRWLADLSTHDHIMTLIDKLDFDPDSK
jgi:ADP-ribosylglycohydrolase